MNNNQRLAKASPVKLGQHIPGMEAVAQRHALGMARSGVMDHSGWSVREAELKKYGHNLGEVVAHAWGTTRDGAITAFWQAWRTSRPHWAILNSGNIFGLAMAESRYGFFACGIIGTK